jgi:VWFA-related protein
MGGMVLCAQQPAGIQNENGVYTLHEGTHLVLLDVTVTDKHGHPVAGLTKDDFKLLEDGQPQTIKFFEEHAPVDSAEIARQKAAALAGQLNTFTNYEPFTGRPVTVLLLNELFPKSMNSDDHLNPLLHGPWLQMDVKDSDDPLHQQMLDTVQNAPPDTPFAIYLLDSELRLVQPVTTDRALLLARINEIWKKTHFGSEQLINPTEYAASLKKYQDLQAEDIKKYRDLQAEDIPVRRRIASDAMQQLVLSLKGEPGKKDLFFFTGAFQCSVVGSPSCPQMPFPNDSKNYLCGLMDTLEQGRMSIYRYYGEGEIAYGFGCPSSVDLGTSAHYYTLYYTPTNGEWNGKYRATKVEVKDEGPHLAYRKGYYGTPENVAAHYYTGKVPAVALVSPNSSGSTITATAVAEETADSDSLDTGAAAALPNPVAAVFTVQVIPAETTVVPDSVAVVKDKKTNEEIEKQKQEQEYRQLTLRFSMPASEFKVMPSDGGRYVARLAIAAAGYSEGRLAASNGIHAVKMVASFNGAEDPRIATFTITGTLTLNVPEHGKSRWLYVSVRDLATGQLGSLVIPMGQIKMPEKQ